MKNTLKLSAIALFVAVSTGCISNDKASDQKAPEAINSPKNSEAPKQAEKQPESSTQTADTQPTTPVADAQPTQPTEPTADAQPTQPTEPVADAQPTQPTEPVADAQPTQPTEPTADTQPTQPTTPPTAETTPPTGSNKIVSVDGGGKQWRLVGLDGSYKGQSEKVSHTGAHLTGIGGYTHSFLRYSAKDNLKHECDHNGRCSGTVLSNSSGNAAVNRNTVFDLDKLAQQDGKPYLGLHQGQHFDKDLYGDVVDAHVNEKGELVTSRTPAGEHPINYLFINQPYSSYGMIYTNENDVARFSVIQRAGRRGDNNYNYADFNVYQYAVVDGKETDTIIWNDSIKGDAVYKGDVIAKILKNGDSHIALVSESPKVDGTITLNAKFDTSWDRTYVSGEIDSQALGKITLNRTPIRRDLEARGDLTHKISDRGGSYRVQFGGKDLNDAVGRVDVWGGNIPGTVKEYEAVFGATKQ